MAFRSFRANIMQSHQALRFFNPKEKPVEIMYRNKYGYLLPARVTIINSFQQYDTRNESYKNVVRCFNHDYQEIWNLPVGNVNKWSLQ